MTERTVFRSSAARHRAPDFTSLSSTEAQRRVRQLIAAGLPETTVGDLVGWDVVEVRRALSAAPADLQVVDHECD